ncbi:MAG: FAD-dependent oxidoreductase [Planctomycetota bacterium]
MHRDSHPPSLLTDGKWHSASSQSVQYDGDVTIVADLGAERGLSKIHVMAYQRRNRSGDDFEVKSIAVYISSDRQGWKQAAVIENKRLGQSLPEPWGPVEFSASIEGRGHYLKFDVRKSPDVNRVLLGEIVIADDQPPDEPDTPPARIPPTPMQVKRVLDEALLEAGVQFLYSCYATDVLRDGDGRPAGIVMANRSGRQAVRAKVIIDSMRDGSFASFAKAEQIARDKTWDPAVEDSSEVLFQVPPDPVRGKATLLGPWPGARDVDPEPFQPAGVDNLFVLGGCADISRRAVAKLLRPLELMKVGVRIGGFAASQAKGLPRPVDVKIRGTAVTAGSGSVREDLGGIRLERAELEAVTSEARGLPVVGSYDVVVVGGGTGGAPAGIAAARQGAKTVVLEYLNGLGGVGTMGYIASYYYGYREGFTKEVDNGVNSIGGYAKPRRGGWNVEWKKQWYRSELRKAGADIWFGTLGCGAYVEGRDVKGVVVATPAGRGVILAKTVIDSTGNADIAASAGAECVYTDGTSVAVQGAGLPGIKLGAGYTNTDWTFIDDGDILDVWRSFVVAKKKYKDAYDLGQLLDTRERRRIVGGFTMSPMDISTGRTYPDTIVISRSNFDTHGFTEHPIFAIRPPDREEMFVNVPYRCLLPEGLDGILVTGLGVSAHRDAMPVIRMQADIQNQGYAAGVAAAMAAESGKKVRDIDLKRLQKHLVEKGNLPESVLTDADSFPLPKEEIAEAVERVVNDFEGLEIILAQPDDALPLLSKAYRDAETPKNRLAYAHILGMLGEPSVAETLAAEVSSRTWDKGWNYKGMGQFGPCMSELDSLIIALGRTRDAKALDPIIEKVGQIDAESEVSHSRAVAVALETLGHPDAAKPLAQLLGKPGFRGHAFTEIEDARQRTPANPTDNETRNRSLRELILARALYRCGDYEGLGEEILNDYARDLRAHYARHASAVLQQRE